MNQLAALVDQDAAVLHHANPFGLEPGRAQVVPDAELQPDGVGPCWHGEDFLYVAGDVLAGPEDVEEVDWLVEVRDSRHAALPQHLAELRVDARNRVALGLHIGGHLVGILRGPRLDAQDGDPAVVLENAAQYEEAGLEQGEGSDSPSMSVPSVPEPETWALLLVMLAVMLAALWHQRRIAPPALNRPHT